VKPGLKEAKPVGSSENVLIVEDEEQWRGVYERAVSAQGSGQMVKVAKDLASAERLIDAAKFAVAFVDVGLDASDDKNIDGLRVMEKIRAAGDETSIVVVTGRSGQDVLSITRDAIKKYDAYDTVGKSSVKPADIRRLLEGGLEAYRKATVAGRRDAHEALRGQVGTLSWDDRVMRATQFKGDAGKFYTFLHGLFGAYLPIVARRDKAEATIELSAGLFHGDYWSRAIAAAIVICFGPEQQFKEAILARQTGGGPLARYDLRDPINELAGHAVRGAVFPLADGRREEYGGREA
jgi:ActR/RegA family two-component response regulator